MTASLLEPSIEKKLQPALSPAEVLAVRAQFPVLQQHVYEKPLIYLDNGATTQKPQRVIDRLSRFYSQEYGTVRRGVYALSQGSTEAFADARETAARFLNAASADEIVFVRGCTEALNLVAHSFGRHLLGPDDEIILTAMEHHANLVPWQLLAQEKGCQLRFIPMDERGVLDMQALEAMLSPKTKLVSVVHVSNALGTVNPVEEIIRKAHAVGAKVLLDGAQSAPHMPIDVQALDCDFFAFSGHKVYGPTGIGVLYGKMSVLETMAPFMGGGDMIETVTLEASTFAPPPRRFEAGTPAIAEAIGLAEALRFVMEIGLERIEATEQALLAYATEQLLTVPGLKIVGTAPNKAGVISFLMDSAHPLDIGTLVDHEGVAIRTGHHCTQPIMRQLGIPATARASLGLYNTPADIDALVKALHKVNDLCQ